MMEEEKEMTFAELLEQREAPLLEGPLTPGERVKGQVVLITQEAVFIDFGAKSEGWAEVQEFLDEKGELTIEVGQEVELTFIGFGPSGAHLGNSLRGGPGAAGQALVRKAFEAKVPVEGTVTGINKGGLEVSISGVRAFCPFSQMDLTYLDKPEAFVGTTQKFLVTQYEEEGRNIVLSRRAVLKAEKEAQAQATRERLTAGATFTGRVTRLTPFGAFVDLGGVEGLVHVSEISLSTVKNPADVLSLGQEVAVKVLEVKGDEKNGERISLSIKALEPDPWEGDFDFEEGDILTGTVRNLVPYGAFVEIAPGLEGLVHISEISKKRIHHPREALKEGQPVEVMVLEINREQRRISLSLKEASSFADTDLFEETQTRSGNIIRRRRKKTEEPLSALEENGLPASSPFPSPGLPLPRVGWTGKGIVRSVKPYGYFVDLPDLGPHQRGLLHNSETTAPPLDRASKGWKEGDEIQVQIIRIDDQGRISLSQKAVLDQEEHAEVKDYQERIQATGKLGTLADLFKKR